MKYLKIFETFTHITIKMIYLLTSFYDEVYVYKPYQPNDWLYTKIGFKYYFNENVFSSMILKTHYAVAEVLEFGIGYRL